MTRTTLPASPRDFAVVPPGTAWFWLPLAVLAVTAIGIVLLGLVRDARALWSLPAIAALLPIVLVALRRRRVTLANGVLTVAAGLNTCKVAATELDAAHARIVDLHERTELRPFLKTNGSNAPGYRAGHYRLRDRSRAFVLVTERSRVLLLPRRDGGTSLLLSLAQPQALLDALQRVRTA